MEIVHEIIKKNVGDRKGMFGEEETVGERAVKSIVETLISNPYCATYMSDTITFRNAALEFERFIKYIEKSSESSKLHLSSLVFPMFVLLYLELLRNFEALDARSFYKSQVKIFKNTQGYGKYLKELYSLTTVQDVENHAYFSKFWKMKYIVTIPGNVLEDLKEFLTYEESTTLFCQLHLYFYCENADLSRYADVSNSNMVSISESKDDSDQKDYLTTRKSLMPPYINSFSFNSKKCFSAVDINENESEISFAFDSCIFIKDLDGLVIPEELDKNVVKYFNEGEYDRKIYHVVGDVCALKYVPSQPKQLLASSNNKIVLLNTGTCRIQSVFEMGHEALVWNIDVSPIGTLFATAGEKPACHVYSLCQPAFIRQLAGHNESVHVVKFHPNGMYLATGSSDRTIKLHDLNDACLLRSFYGHTSEVFRIIFSPDGKYLVSADTGGNIKFFNIKKNDTICELSSCQSPEESGGRVTSMCYDEDGSMFMSSCFKGIVRMWDVRDLEELLPELVEEAKYIAMPLLMKYKTNVLRLISVKEIIDNHSS